MKRRAYLETELWRYPAPTLRTFFVLLELIELYGNPLIASITEIKQYCNVCISKIPPSQPKMRSISHKSISKALDELKELGLFDIERKGNVTVITVTGQREKDERKTYHRYHSPIEQRAEEH